MSSFAAAVGALFADPNIGRDAVYIADGGAPVLLRTEMDGGHGGASGRYQGWEDTAWEYAFLLTALGATRRVV